MKGFPEDFPNRSLETVIRELYEAQLHDWPQFASAVASLEQVKTRTLNVGGNVVRLQNNPARIRSTGASIDPQVLAKRPCFLCAQNRPVEQRGILVEQKRYVVLANPFPIFRYHFTVVLEKHNPQNADNAVVDMLSIAEHLGQGFAVIFNGAKAGASAPDHLHYQLLPADELVLFSQIVPPFESNILEAQVHDYVGAGMVVLRAQDRLQIQSASDRVIEAWKNMHPDNGALLNLIVRRSGPLFEVIIIPRRRHRPNCYGATGDEQFLVSPAAIELGGLFVFPRLEDFERASEGVLRRIFDEVSLTKAECSVLIESQ